MKTLSANMKAVSAALFVLSAVCAASLGGAGLLFRTADDNGRRRLVFAVSVAWFVYYVLFLAGLLFLNSFMVRQSSAYEYGYKSGWLNKANFIPFKSLIGFVSDVFSGKIPLSVFAVNIVGNMLAFAPLGVFMPLIFRRFRRFVPFLVFMLVTVGTLEAVQGMFGMGVCDIDDVILNCGGALVVHRITTRLAFALPD